MRKFCFPICHIDIQISLPATNPLLLQRTNTVSKYGPGINSIWLHRSIPRKSPCWQYRNYHNPKLAVSATIYTVKLVLLQSELHGGVMQLQYKTGSVLQANLYTVGSSPSGETVQTEVVCRSRNGT
jgi:hypothetical protein